VFDPAVERRCLGLAAPPDARWAGSPLAMKLANRFLEVESSFNENGDSVAASET